jgi:hypothetical protein
LAKSNDADESSSRETHDSVLIVSANFAPAESQGVGHLSKRHLTSVSVGDPADDPVFASRTSASLLAKWQSASSQDDETAMRPGYSLDPPFALLL